MFFSAGGKSGEGSLDQERGELFAIDFCEDGEEVGESGVGDPHFLAVQDVVLAIGREDGAGSAIQSVRSGSGFRQGVGANRFSGGQFGEILFLLLHGAEINDGQHADAAVGAPGGGKSGVLGHVVGDDGGGDFVHFEAAVGLGNLDSTEAEVTGLFQQIARDRIIFVFDFFGLGQNLVDGKLFGRLADHPLLLGEIFGREDFAGLALF